MRQGHANAEALQVAVRRMWAETLEVAPEQIPLDVAFFALGGDSLKILAVSERVGEAYFSTCPELAPGIADYFSFGTVRSFAERLRSTLNEVQAPDPAVEGSSNCVAVIGMACRFPAAAGYASFWRNLCEGREAIQRHPDTDLVADRKALSTSADGNVVRAGVLLDDIRLFDAEYFGMSRADVLWTSPEQRLLIECAEEALQDAGYGALAAPRSVGVFVGSGLSSYFLELLKSQQGGLETARGMSLVAYNTCAAARVSHVLDLVGPSLTIDTACSSSLVAVHQAYLAVARNECRMALAGGATVRQFSPKGHVAEPGGIFSSDGRCRPFDASAQGTVGSSGAGLVLLKRLDDALADGDHIHAVLRGSAVNNDGGRKLGYFAPSAAGQEAVIRSALASAKLKPIEIDYLETHGTGTSLGDRLELAALCNVHAPLGKREPRLPLGALKANVGHMEAAAGIGSLIKSILVLQHEVVPPAVHFEEWVDPAMKSMFEMPRELVSLPSKAVPLRAAVSSFGIGGTNAHVILEQAPSVACPEGTILPQLLVLSARSRASLQALCESVAAALSEASHLRISDVAYTLAVGRRHLEFRTYVVACNLSEAISGLRADAGVPAVAVRAAEGLTACVRCDDEYTPRFEEIVSLVDSCPLFRAGFDDCADHIRTLVGKDLRELATVASWESSSDKTRALVRFSLAYSYARIWTSLGLSIVSGDGSQISERIAECVRNECSLADALADIDSASARSDDGTRTLGASATRGKAECQDPVTADMLVIDLEDLALCGPTSGDTGLVSSSSVVPGPQRLLNSIGELWKAGGDLNWQALWSSTPCRRVPLPTYPFERREHWALSDAESRGDEGEDGAQEGSSYRLLAPVWEQLLPLGGNSFLAGKPDALLIFCRSNATEKALREQLKVRGSSLATASLGPNTGREGSHFTVRDVEALTEVLTTLASEGESPVKLIYCAETADVSAESELPTEELLTQALLDLYDLCRSIKIAPVRPKELVLVTRGAFELGAAHGAVPHRAMLHAALENLSTELHGVACRAIDAAAIADRGAHELDREQFSLAQEIVASGGHRLVALRGGKRWSRTVKPVHSNDLSSQSRLKRHGVYLVTGGFGVVGGALVRHLAASVSARLILVSRVPIPSRHLWNGMTEDPSVGPDVRARIEEILELEARGARVLSFCADVTSLPEMRHVVAVAEKEFGRIDGVLHCAGVKGPAALHPASREEVLSVLRAKVLGTSTLHQALRGRDLDFFMCASSVSTLAGRPGWFAYSAANAYQDAFCESMEGRGHCRFLSIGWDVWADRSDGDTKGKAPSAEASGKISEAAGVDAFLRTLAANGPRWFVMSAESSTAMDSPKVTKRVDKHEPIAPRSGATRGSATIEADLIVIWKELLGLDEVGVAEDFFELGGDSLSAVDLQSRIGTKFGVSPSIAEIVSCGTIGTIAQRVEKMLQSA